MAGPATVPLLVFPWIQPRISHLSRGATLAAALGSGGLPALRRLNLAGIPASAAAEAAVGRVGLRVVDIYELPELPGN